MQKKNKRLFVTLGIVLGCIVAVCILFAVVFKLRTVDVEFRTRAESTETNLSSGILDLVKESGDFDYGSCILFLDVDKYIDNIEKNNPYVKVEQVIRYFPSTLRVYISERIPKYRIADADSKVSGEVTKWYILDEDFKVLDKVSTEELYDSDAYPASDSSLTYYSKTVEIESSSISTSIGEFFDFNVTGTYLTEIFTGIYGKAEDYTIAKSILIETDAYGVLKFTITMRNSNSTESDDGGIIYFYGTESLTDLAYAGIELYQAKLSTVTDPSTISMWIVWDESLQKYVAYVPTETTD